MHYFIPCDPMPCPRPRFVSRGKFVSTYYPKNYKDWKAGFESQLEAVLENTIYDVDVSVQIAVIVARPKTTKLSAPKPDADNYAKAVLDALTQAGAWGDDKQVTDLFVTKHWALEGEEPGVYLRIVPLESMSSHRWYEDLDGWSQP